MYGIGGACEGEWIRQGLSTSRAHVQRVKAFAPPATRPGRPGGGPYRQCKNGSGRSRSRNSGSQQSPPRENIRLLRPAYCVIRLTWSSVNEVCSEASSVITNDSVTVWPLYASRSKVRIW
jgi:hypothetical protein